MKRLLRAPAARVHRSQPVRDEHRFAYLFWLKRHGDTGLACFVVAGHRVTTPVHAFEGGAVFLPFSGQWRIPRRFLDSLDEQVNRAWARAGEEQQ